MIQKILQKIGILQRVAIKVFWRHAGKNLHDEKPSQQQTNAENDQHQQQRQQFKKTTTQK